MVDIVDGILLFPFQMNDADGVIRKRILSQFSITEKLMRNSTFDMKCSCCAQTEVNSIENNSVERCILLVEVYSSIECHCIISFHPIFQVFNFKFRLFRYDLKADVRRYQNNGLV
ncbi:hypothetical protein BLOT_007276 [Blomia tropicalis]|nr:hypothetical protein BLOT_007276 [Blomia tropicalis]